MCTHAHTRVNRNCTEESRGSESHTHSTGCSKLLPFSFPVFIYLWIEGHRPGHKIYPTNHSTYMIDGFIMLHCHSHKFCIQWPEINMQYFTSCYKPRTIHISAIVVGGSIKSSSSSSFSYGNSPHYLPQSPWKFHLEQYKQVPFMRNGHWARCSPAINNVFTEPGLKVLHITHSK